MNRQTYQVTLTATLAAAVFFVSPSLAEDAHEDHGTEHSETGEKDEHGDQGAIQLSDDVVKEFDIEVGIVVDIEVVVVNVNTVVLVTVVRYQFRLY